MSLVYDLSKVRGRTGKVFSFCLETSEFNHNGYSLLEPLIFEGQMKADGFFIYLIAKVSAKLQGVCGRCLAPLEFNVSCDINETLLFQGESGRVKTDELLFGELDEKYWLYDKLAYDFSPLVVGCILDNLPLAPVCPSDCAVLEEKEEIILDPRWASLAQLKQDGEV